MQHIKSDDVLALCSSKIYSDYFHKRACTKFNFPLRNEECLGGAATKRIVEGGEEYAERVVW